MFHAFSSEGEIKIIVFNWLMILQYEFLIHFSARYCSILEKLNLGN